MDIIKEFIEKYSKDHLFNQIYENRHFVFATGFLDFLEKTLLTLESVSSKAAQDFISNKLRASKGSTYDTHALFSSLCELNIIYSFIKQSDVPHMCLSIEKFSVWSRKVVHLPTHFYSLAGGRPISFLSEYHLHNF